MKCAICEIRRPRRSCPAVRGDICAPCCGSGREVTLDCPLECSYLQDAHKHERPPDLDPGQMPNKDVDITERFVEEHAPLFTFLARALLRSALASTGIIDADVREALDAMARTYRTLQSGLVYETRPANLVAASVQQRLAAELDGLRKQLRDETGMETLRDADVLGVLVMLQRMEFTRNNGRPRGRAFLDFLSQEFSAAPGSGGAGSSNLIVPA
ncbi:MAG TPA: hypothetical protein VLH09_08240 [Bryobacteraceae bacterium]|nr:hypothetical protein [Bryobacteraceae bacterium]